VEQILSPVLSLEGRSFGFLTDGQNRERLRPVRSAAIYQTKDDSNSDSQSGAEGDEIPQSGKSQKKDQCAANYEYQAHKSAPHRKLVHADTGMPVLGHDITSPHFLIIPPIGSGLKRYSTGPYPYK
jgi:hypothetical protein